MSYDDKGRFRKSFPLLEGPERDGHQLFASNPAPARLPLIYMSRFLSSLLLALGAVSFAADAPPPAKHWSLQPRSRPDLPRFAQQWARNPIDTFVLKAGLQPAAEADRQTLIRRVTFDLLGLPPTLEDVDRFVRDPAPDAYERLVDRLLASPQHGERWGRHWLDVVRFAESEGFEYDRHRPGAWRYRDYVIRAFNSDQP